MHWKAPRLSVIGFSGLATKLSLMTLVGGDEAQIHDGRVATGWDSWMAARALTWMLEWEEQMSSRMRQMQSGIHMLRHRACVQAGWLSDGVGIGDVRFSRAATLCARSSAMFACACP